MTSSELWQWSASDIVEAIRTKKISSREAVTAQIARIEEVNPKVKAISRLMGEEALALADQADAKQARGETLGALHGLPFTIKENIDLAGSATTNGVPAFAELIAPGDAPHIGQLKAAGAIPLARTNMPDFGLRWHTDNALFGPTFNPWDKSRSAGGSSGGDAAALATGMIALGMGNDLAGSLRLPAQACGIASLKPSFGRVASAAYGPQEPPLSIQLFGIQGPMARRVADLELAFKAMLGADPRDPWWVGAPFGGAPLPQPLKVAVCYDPAGQGVDSEVVAGIKRAAEALQEAGYVVEEAEIPNVAKINQLYMQIISTDTTYSVLPLMQQVGSADLVQFTRDYFAVTPPLEIPAYIAAFSERKAFAMAWSEFMTQYPIVLAPVSTQQIFSPTDDLSGIKRVSEIIQAHRLLGTINFIGIPSMAVPVGIGSQSQLPQSVQVIAPRYREDLCLSVAKVIEEKVGILTPIDPKF